MALRPRAIVWMTCAAALIVFAAVQDRVTAGGARQYVTLQRAAFSGRASPVTIDQVMGPAVNRSVRQGAAWGGGVLVVGLALAAISSRRVHGRE